MWRAVRNKRGAMFLYVTIMLALLFPLMMFTIIDFSNMYRASKNLDIALAAAVKSGSSRIDENSVPHGIFYISTPDAINAFHVILDGNLGITSDQVGPGHFEYEWPGGRRLESYVTVYNARHSGYFHNIPAAGAIPSSIYSGDLQIGTDRPAVFGIASYEYTTTSLLGKKKVKIVRFASSQLNIIPPDKRNA